MLSSFFSYLVNCKMILLSLVLDSRCPIQVLNMIHRQIYGQLSGSGMTTQIIFNYQMSMAYLGGKHINHFVTWILFLVANNCLQHYLELFIVVGCSQNQMITKRDMMQQENSQLPLLTHPSMLVQIKGENRSQCSLSTDTVRSHVLVYKSLRSLDCPVETPNNMAVCK